MSQYKSYIDILRAVLRAVLMVIDVISMTSIFSVATNEAQNVQDKTPK